MDIEKVLVALVAGAGLVGILGMGRCTYNMTQPSPYIKICLEGKEIIREGYNSTTELCTKWAHIKNPAFKKDFDETHVDVDADPTYIQDALKVEE